MRIVILSDSLGRPRPELHESERTLYSDTYAYTLKRHFSNDDVEIIYIGSLDTEEAIVWSRESVAYREPDFVIYHMGINDCAPRIFEKKSNSILFNPIFRKITLNLFMIIIHYFRYHITKYKKKVYVNEDNFSSNFKEMIREVKKYNSEAKFIAISIANSNRLASRSYDINNNINEYNKILSKIFLEGFIDVNKLPIKNILISDGVHLSKVAHQLLANEIIKKIDEMIIG